MLDFSLSVVNLNRFFFILSISLYIYLNILINDYDKLRISAQFVTSIGSGLLYEIIHFVVLFSQSPFILRSITILSF